jgi:hypothetical protein
MPVSFTCHTHIGMEPGELFDLSRNVDARVGSMAKSRERAVAGVVSGLLSEGDEVTWQAWHFAVPLRMSSRFAEKAFLGRYLRNLIEQRNEYLSRKGGAA